MYKYEYLFLVGLKSFYRIMFTKEVGLSCHQFVRIDFGSSWKPNLLVFSRINNRVENLVKTKFPQYVSNHRHQTT